MNDWMVSSVILVGLSAVFAGHGVWTLIAAYRISDLTEWGRMAFVGSVSVLLGAIVEIIAATLVAQHWS